MANFVIYEDFKAEGNRLFGEGKFDEAASVYDRVITALVQMFELFRDGYSGEEELARKCLLQSCRTNLAMCHLKLLRFGEARDVCDEVLAGSGAAGHAKAFYRRGAACVGLGELRQGKADFERCLRLEPANKAAQNQIIRCNEQLNAQLKG